MSLIGYRDLNWLKLRLLPADMGLETDYDVDLTAIGLGVAAMFDSATGRKLRRSATAAFQCAADVDSVVLQSYPIESITSATLISGGVSTVITPSITGTQKASGIVEFGYTVGTFMDRLEIVSSGGYWCDDGETMPTGAVPLPDDLLGAWVQQCRAICEAENIFRAKGASAPEKKTGSGLNLETLTLLPGVKAVLRLYTRFS